MIEHRGVTISVGELRRLYATISCLRGRLMCETGTDSVIGVVDREILALMDQPITRGKLAESMGFSMGYMHDRLNRLSILGHVEKVSQLKRKGRGQGAWLWIRKTAA